ncbi:MAG: ATP-binding cassette domain-containing protein [Roseofilum sp. SBFL]|uniref:ABC transporter ATP-binding protein n=1 Tax=unclassified Roseofilum TaxID=2620099 RepID=UPI001B2D3224|nr:MULTISPECIES: ATP-binding cassette domain-containing protein [unclassified Roseofilum]MBP0012240.1 ATP-binding cassette domain-containing protein [Roseofilum sp. SID3]MBP0025034.1 ATP-binding cassette domain-containing protein [Roseofilum sp. SID2]MBP0036754.1 ATP-binding cassette domain-containing protein [Roseofilum sp. SID1]MBP0041696.1 ATP-binding cassette domain-containing protein [Roseofilum sp. SBFL]
MNTNTCLSTHQIGRRIQGKWLWRNLSFSLTPGSRLGLVGESGKGKTLLLRALAGLDPLDEGQIFWSQQPGEERNLTPKIFPYYRSQAIYIHQQSSVFEGTVEDNLKVVYTLAIHEHKTYNLEFIQMLLTELNRPSDFLQRPATTLSGGERQILSLLRALQLNPMILFLDEPTASLDPQTTEKVEDLIDSWIQENPYRCCIWTSHDPQQMERVTSDRLEL